MISSWVCLICMRVWKRTVSEPLPEGGVDFDPHRGVEGRGVDRGPLAVDAERPALVGGLGDFVVEAFEKILESRFGQHSRDQLGAFLLAVDDGFDADLGVLCSCLGSRPFAASDMPVRRCRTSFMSSMTGSACWPANGVVT